MFASFTLKAQRQLLFHSLFLFRERIMGCSTRHNDPGSLVLKRYLLEFTFIWMH
jgi:hypothetical protein